MANSARKSGLTKVDDVKNVAELSGKAQIDNLDSFLSTAARTADGVPIIFKADEAVIHFNKHSSKVMKALGKTSYNLKEYMLDAHHVIKTGTYAPELNAYVKIVGGSAPAKAALVGLEKGGAKITTFHIKKIKDIAKKAPSLGWEL